MTNIRCKKCRFFTPEWCPVKRDSLDPDLIRDCERFRVKRNYDRIRRMGIGELADWLVMNGNGDDYEYWLKWLKEECD